ncbi:MAG TPA: glycosyltransferase family A protein, partial [Tepidisphaeraceae bacterium]|nr:glycosyltransferase family A protein [Tepidisphaeraceae bacterium]
MVEVLDLIFNDASDAFQIVRPPNAEDGKRIAEFAARQLKSGTPNLILQCQMGIGRSYGAFAALLKILGTNYDEFTGLGTYNRSLYRYVLATVGMMPDPEPTVSMAVRVKYDPERLHLFLLSMRRQRYDNWEVIAVTDGPNVPAKRLVESIGDSRIKLIQTDRALGRWGHPHRQIGIDACKGEWIGLSNDDNYYVPGYFEQMVRAGRNADIVMCPFLHSYFAWAAQAPGTDLGAWIARSSLIRQTPWAGT